MAKSKKKNRLKVSGKEWSTKPTPGFERPSLALPSGAKMHTIKAGKSSLSIVPFVAGEGNPNFKKGEGAFERTYFIHRIGPKGASYVCLTETFGEKCPVCEYQRKLFKGDADDIEAAKGMGAKARQLWNVFDHDNPKAGVQIMELSFHAFGKLLKSRIEDEDDDEAFHDFADPDSGKILRIKWSEESFGTGTFLSAASIDFKDRPALPDKILEGAFCLDDLVKKTEYKTLKEIFLLGQESADKDEDDDDDEDDDEPKKGKGKGRAAGKGKGKSKEEDDDDDDEDDDDEDEDDEDEDEDDEPKKGKGKSKGKKDDDDDEDDDDDDDDDDEDEDDDDDDDEPPAKSKGKGKGKSKDDDDDDDEDDDDDDDDDEDEDDDDEDDEPPAKGKGKGKGKATAGKGKGKAGGRGKKK